MDAVVGCRIVSPQLSATAHGFLASGGHIAKSSTQFIVYQLLEAKDGYFMSVKDVLKFADAEKASYVNVRFTDLVGAWHHLTFPIGQLTEGCFEEGFGFDASSLRGWAHIHESDMLLIPDPSRFWIEPRNPVQLVSHCIWT